MQIFYRPMGERDNILDICQDNVLAKLDGGIKKDIMAMATKERWAFFFEYLTDESKRGFPAEQIAQVIGLTAKQIENL